MLAFAVTFSAWYGGLGPALTAVLLGALSAAYFLLSPRGSLAIPGWDQQVGMALYLSVGVGIALLGGSMGLARRRAEANALAEWRQREPEGTGDLHWQTHYPARTTLHLEPGSWQDYPGSLS